MSEMGRAVALLQTTRADLEGQAAAVVRPLFTYKCRPEACRILGLLLCRSPRDMALLSAGAVLKAMTDNQALVCLRFDTLPESEKQQALGVLQLVAGLALCEVAS